MYDVQRRRTLYVVVVTSVKQTYIYSSRLSAAQYYTMYSAVVYGIQCSSILYAVDKCMVYNKEVYGLQCSSIRCTVQ